MSKKFQVVGIGNAMVDVLAQCDDAFLADNGIEKGIMQLTDMARGVELYGKVGPAQEVSGGSCANSIAGIAIWAGARPMSARSRMTSLARSLPMICVRRVRFMKPPWRPRITRPKPDVASCW